MLNPKYIVVHTIASEIRNCDRDMIDAWHRKKGWSEIGYHFIIINNNHDSLHDGTVQEGRDIRKRGAHAKGINSSSIGICCVGNGDIRPFTEKQTKSLVALVSQLMNEYAHITVDHFIGHREVNRLIEEGVADGKYETFKTCPGNLVDMDKLRRQVKEYRENNRRESERQVSDREIMQALQTLSGIRSDRFPKSYSELQAFLSHPEVEEFCEG